jgi:hypothetical protein
MSSALSQQVRPLSGIHHQISAVAFRTSDSPRTFLAVPISPALSSKQSRQPTVPNGDKIIKINRQRCGVAGDTVGEEIRFHRPIA